VKYNTVAVFAINCLHRWSWSGVPWSWSQTAWSCRCRLEIWSDSYS